MDDLLSQDRNADGILDTQGENSASNIGRRTVEASRLKQKRQKTKSRQAKTTTKLIPSQEAVSLAAVKAELQ